MLAGTIIYASSNSQIAGPQVPGADKVEHFLIYGLLATLLARVPSIAQSPRLGLALAVVLTSAFGITDEWHQSMTPGRSVEVMDWVVDTLGATLAVTLYSRWALYRVALELPLARRLPPALIFKQSPETLS